MKIKLLTVASVAAMGMSVSLAGGPAHHSSTRHHVSGVFVGVNAGMVYSAMLDRNAKEWAVADNDTYDADTFTFKSSKAPWAFGAGGLLGYQVDHHWAVEFGYNWHQDQKAEYFNNVKTDHYTLKKHNYYFAVKGMLPLDHEFSAYMLAGVAHTDEKLNETYTGGEENHAPTQVKDTFWSPMAGVGISYDMGEGFHLNLQYEFIGGLTQTDLTDEEHTVLGDSSQAVTIGVDYLFDM